jgi:hypothetical protein
MPSKKNAWGDILAAARLSPRGIEHGRFASDIRAKPDFPVLHSERRAANVYSRLAEGVDAMAWKELGRSVVK